MTEKDKQLLEKIRIISSKGNSAEVKCDKDGNYVVYEIKKKRMVVG